MQTGAEVTLEVVTQPPPSVREMKLRHLENAFRHLRAVAIKDGSVPDEFDANTAMQAASRLIMRERRRNLYHGG